MEKDNYKSYNKEEFIDYNNLGKSLEIELGDIAIFLNVTSRELKKNQKSLEIQQGLKKIVHVYGLLEEMFQTKEETKAWLKDSNPDYNGLSPLEIISRGEIDSIIEYLKDIKKGSLS